MIRFRYLPFTWGKPKFQVCWTLSLSLFIQNQSISCVAQFHISLLLESEEVKEDKAPLLQQSAWFLWKAFANNLTDQCCPCQAREEAKWPRTKWRKMSPVINHRPAIHPSWTLLPVLVILIHCGKNNSYLRYEKYWSKLDSLPTWCCGVNMCPLIYFLFTIFSPCYGRACHIRIKEKNCFMFKNITALGLS